MPDNIINKVPRIVLTSSVSKRTGGTYHQLSLTFVNGYTYKAFVNDEQLFAIKDAIGSRDSTDNSMLDQVD